MWGLTGLGWGLPELRIPATLTRSAPAPAAGRVPQASQSKAHPEQGEAPVVSIYQHWSG